MEHLVGKYAHFLIKRDKEFIKKAFLDRPLSSRAETFLKKSVRIKDASQDDDMDERIARDMANRLSGTAISSAKTVFVAASGAKKFSQSIIAIKEKRQTGAINNMQAAGMVAKEAGSAVKQSAGYVAREAKEAGWGTVSRFRGSGDVGVEAFRAPINLAFKSKAHIQSMRQAIKAIKMLPLLIAHLPLLMPLLLTICIFAGFVFPFFFTPGMLKMQEVELNTLYLRATELDCDLSLDAAKYLRTIEEASGKAAGFTVNGSEQDPSIWRHESNIDALILYIDTKGANLSLEEKLEMLKDIHGALARVSVTPNLEVEAVLTQLFPYLSKNDPDLYEEMTGRIDAMEDYGMYEAFTELENPFGNEVKARITKRMGWSLPEGAGSPSVEKTMSIAYLESSQDIYAPLSGMISQNQGAIQIAGNAGAVSLGNVDLIGGKAGDEVLAGQLIGRLQSGQALEVAYRKTGEDYNPAFYMKGVSQAIFGGTGLSAAAIVDIALGELGNSGEKYWTWYNPSDALTHSEWCAKFVSWCANEAGILGTDIPKFASCAVGIDYFKGKGQYMPSGSGYIPSSGDLIFFDWEPNGRANHVGIVERVDGNLVYTVEGNSGNRVRQLTYSISSGQIFGYAAIN
ncbi:MAG: CHAP domain-containing protein [Eubacteriaceae bacterium]|nr:CHAP domain-containing protein [Eubacteriaceae bacterium]